LRRRGSSGAKRKRPASNKRRPAPCATRGCGPPLRKRASTSSASANISKPAWARNPRNSYPNYFPLKPARRPRAAGDEVVAVGGVPLRLEDRIRQAGHGRHGQITVDRSGRVTEVVVAPFSWERGIAISSVRCVRPASQKESTSNPKVGLLVAIRVS